MQPPRIRTVSPVPVRRVRPVPVIHYRSRPVPVTHYRREKPVLVSWTTGVSQAEGEAAVAGVGDVLRAAGVEWEIRTLGASVWGQGDYGCADWYQKKAMFDPPCNRGYGPQANGNQICIDMLTEPWQQREPHYDLMIVNRDLSTGEKTNNFVFGLTQPGACSVQSVCRLREEIADPALMLRVLRRVARHEVGHIFGAATGPTHTENTALSLGQHCTNLCCMRQGLSTSEWVRQLQEETTAGITFCANCSRELQNWCRE